MFSTFKKKPTSIATYIAIIGDFSPNIFQTTWFEKHGIISDSDAENLVSNVDRDHAFIEFSYCRFEARTRVLVFETDQLGFLTQTLDLVGLMLSILKNLPFRGIQAHILTHYDIENSSAFIGKIAKNQFWEDISNGSYTCNEIEVKIPSNNPKLDTAISLEVCPKNKHQMHINVRDSVFVTDDSLIKEINSSVTEDIKSSFNRSIDLINKIRNYEFE